MPSFWHQNELFRASATRDNRAATNTQTHGYQIFFWLILLIRAKWTLLHRKRFENLSQHQQKCMENSFLLFWIYPQLGEKIFCAKGIGGKSKVEKTVKNVLSADYPPNNWGIIQRWNFGGKKLGVNLQRVLTSFGLSPNFFGGKSICGHKLGFGLSPKKIGG
jgi:hypothetical protein